MIPALNLGSGYLPYGMTARDLPHGEEADSWCDDCNRDPCECVCLGCGERECVCGEDFDCAACMDTGIERSGVCHCGDPMEGHAIIDNHSPVEMTCPCQSCDLRPVEEVLIE